MSFILASVVATLNFPNLEPRRHNNRNLGARNDRIIAALAILAAEKRALPEDFYRSEVSPSRSRGMIHLPSRRIFSYHRATTIAPRTHLAASR